MKRTVPLLVFVVVVSGCASLTGDQLSTYSEDGDLNLDTSVIEKTEFYKEHFNNSGMYSVSEFEGNLFIAEGAVKDSSSRTFMLDVMDPRTEGKLQGGPPNAIISSSITLSGDISLEDEVEEYTESLNKDELLEVDTIKKENGRYVIEAREVSGNNTERYAYHLIGKGKSRVYHLTLIDFGDFQVEAGEELARAIENGYSEYLARN